MTETSKQPDAPGAPGHGFDLDYRFTLADERTFLAWIHAALALGVADVAVVLAA